MIAAQIMLPKLTHHKGRSADFLWILLLGALLFSRAWPRLLTPEVWVEDKVIVSDWIKQGLPSLTQPVNGYLIVLPRLVSGLALSGSFENYPALSTCLTWIVTLAICAFVAFAPSHLKGTKWLAAATLLIPSDPEAFGLTVYLLWWSAVLLFALLFWAHDGKLVPARVMLLGLASLSSPACIATLPAYVIRGMLLRHHKGEVAVAFSAIAFALVQAYAMWPLKSGAALSMDDLAVIPQKFFGSYLVGNLFPSGELILGLGGCFLLLVWVACNMRSWPQVGLAYLLAVSVLMSMSRVDIHMLHQTLAGPRYFFLPYILISWVLVQAVFQYAGTWKAWLAAGLLCLGVVNAIPTLWRLHSDLEWEKHAQSCAHFRRYDLPVHFDGSLDGQWHLRLDGAECAKLVQQTPNRRSFPYQRIRLVDQSMNHAIGSSALMNTKWSQVIGAEETAFKGRNLVLLKPSEPYPTTISFRASRGQVVLIRPAGLGDNSTISIDDNKTDFFDSLPAGNGWMALALTNQSLPGEFVVSITASTPSSTAGPAIAFQPE